MNIGIRQDNASWPVGSGNRDSAASAGNDPTITGRLLGIWRLGEPLHEAASSRLWTAQPADCVGSNRWDYVVKSSAREGAGEASARLGRFISAATAVRHPNLVTVLDGCVEATEPFLVMPRLPSRSLADFVQSGTVQPLPVILWLARQTADAVAALHRAGFVHGDLCAENVLLTPQGHATVIGLGDARRQPPQVQLHADDIVATAADDADSLGRILWQLLPLSDREAALGEGPAASVWEAVADLIAELIDPERDRRPTIDQAVARLMRLELDSLGKLIRPETPRRSFAKAA